jgi:histidine triad (HIT) family protein
MQDSIFTKIIKGEIPCYKIAENDDFISFLDINPRVLGHTLVIPKVQIDYIFDIEDPLYVELFRFSKNIAKALKKTFDCERIGMSVIGLEVPHTHIHLLPIKKISDMNFENKPIKLENEQLESLTKDIIQNLQF